MDPQLIRAIESVAKPNWAAVVQAVGAVLTVLVSIVGFIFVWRQIRSLKQALHSETHNKVYAEDFEIIKVFVDKPHLRPYFYQNVEVKVGSDDEAKVQTIAELWCCHFEHVMLQLDHLPQATRQTWVKYIKFLRDRSPAIRTFWEAIRKEGVYIPELDSIMEGGVITAPNQARNKLLVGGSLTVILALAVVAYFVLPGYFLSRAVEHSMAEQALLLEGATPLFDTVIAKKLAVGDSLEHAKKVFTDAGQEFTVETKPPRLQSICHVGRGAGFLVQLDLDDKDRISKVDITKFYEGP